MSNSDQPTDGSTSGALLLSRVETPVGVIEMDRVRANARKAAEYCSLHGIGWRPHVKTHKSKEIAGLQMEAGAIGLTVATPREAEVMAAVADDLLLAYPPVGDSKMQRILNLPGRVRLTVGLDSAVVLQALASASADAGRTTGVLIEIDVGLRRVGVVSAQAAVALAGMARSLPGVEYRGVMFYPGHMRSPAAEFENDLLELGDRLDGQIEALTAVGLPPAVVSGGSTPTLWQSHRLPQLTEVRPGTCIFNDRDILMMGACGVDDLAYSVLATVVSTAVPGQAVVDAGSKALSKEALRAAGSGYGMVLGRHDVSVRALSEEHGVLDLSSTDWRPQIGERVRLIPNHVCLSVNLQDHLIALEGSDLRVLSLEGRGRVPALRSPLLAG